MYFNDSDYMWEEENVLQSPYSCPETYLVPIVFFIVFIVGLIGNSTLIYIFFKNKSIRNIPNTYILSLAVADLLKILTCVPFFSIYFTVDGWPWGVFICKLTETMKELLLGVSAFTLTALSVQRYCVIANPLRELEEKQSTIRKISLIWIFAFILAFPSVIYSHVNVIHYTRDSISYCNSLPELYWKPVEVARAFTYYIGPLCVIAFLYIVMAHRLRKCVSDIPLDVNDEQNTMQVHTHRQVVGKIVITLIIVFFLCFLPKHIFELWFHLNPSTLEDYNDFCHALHILAFCLSNVYSCLNSVALYFVSNGFRQNYNQYLFRRSTVNYETGIDGCS